MNKTKKEPLNTGQITDARRLCEVVKGVPEEKRSVFGVVMLAYMSGMEAGRAYEKDMAQEQEAR